MAKQIIQNGEQLLSVRGKINDNFTELYDKTIQFTTLTDTPSALQAGKYLRVSDAGDSLQFVDLNLTTDFVSLTDTPGALESGKYLRVNDSGTGLQFTDLSITTDFVSLTDTPTTLDAGSYLRVNAAGDAIEQVKTAPPDGGVGDNSHVQSKSNFAGKLPDMILVQSAPSDIQRATFYSISGSTNKIQYLIWSDNTNPYYVEFDNDSTGSNGTFIAPASNWTFLNGATSGISLQQVIDNGHAIFHGQKSGTSGAGGLSVIKNASNFYTELPDKIVVLNGTTEHIMQLLRVDANYFHYLHEDFGDAVTDNRYIYFNNDADGTLQDKNINYWSSSMSSNTLRWYIENGRAVYHGHTDNTGSAGTHPEIQAASNFEGIIPDGVIMKSSGGGGKVYNYQFNYLNASHIYFTHWTDNSGSSSYYAQCNNDATGSGFTAAGNNAAAYVTPNGETTLQQLIDNGNVVYHGGRSIDSGSGGASSVEQLADVDVTTVAPSGGQVLVYDDSDSTWKPGAQSSDFVDLTDTPATLDAGSYLRVNTTGDAIEQIKTAPPDGGIGDSSRIQAVSNFASKIPDYLVLKHSDSNAATMVMELRFVGDNHMTYKDVSYDSYFVNFNNNPAGDGWTKSGSHIQSPIDGVAAPTLQQLIDGGHVVYLGQKSGTSGVGSLAHTKSLHTGFYTELPDAILIQETDTDPGNVWESCARLSYIHHGGHRVSYRSDDNYRIEFDTTNDSDGPAVTSSTATQNLDTSHTLRWYVENGRAIYNGGGVDSTIVSAMIASDGTLTSSSHDWIDTVTKFGTGNYSITFKSGHFTSVPSITMGVDHAGGVSHVTVEYDELTVNGCNVYTRKNKAGQEAGSIDVAFSIMAQHQDRVSKIAPPATGGGTSYTDADVSTYLNGNLDTHIIPDTNATYDIGSAEKKIRHFYLSDNSLKFVGADDIEHPLSVSDGQLRFDDKPVPHKFTDLPDVPDTLTTGGYLRVNTAGDAIEQIKTAPPDGGLGGNSAMQQASNFANKLPDAIVADGGGGKVIQHLYYISTTQILYQGWTQSGTGAYYAYFNNDATGSNGVQNTSWSFLDGATTLQEIIDNGHAIYHGQKSGTSGVGSLSHVKTLTNSSPNGGFYTELPDAIVAESTGDTYNGVFKLHWIKPNATAGGTGWEIIYRTEAFHSGDFYIGYLLDADGTKVAHAGVTHTNATTKNLRWYIENGRALYLGGQQDYGVKAWGKFDGTGSGDNVSLSFTGGNIQSVVRISLGLYKVTFINPAPHADYSVSGSSNPQNYGGATFGVREDLNPVTTTDFHVEVRDQNNNRSNSNRISFQVTY